MNRLSDTENAAMIFYEPNKNWFRDIWNLTTSWTLQKIITGVLWIGFLSAVACTVFFLLNIEPRIHSGIFSLLGIVLSILLVFRTNTAYDRWWEGRKQWGSLVNNSRSLAMMLHASLPKEDKNSRAYFAKHIANFCIALKEHLRHGVKMEELILLTNEEKEELSHAQHQPGRIASWIYSRQQTIYRAGVFTDADVINLTPQHHAMVDILGACERIKKTPIPFSYAVYIKVFVSLYGLMLPFGLYQDFGFYTIPLTMFIFFAMLGLELMAQEIEDPFGLDCNDLPTGDIANTIKKNVFEILQVEPAHATVQQELYSKIF
jgi:ion channel-forming bestrophin family protein